MRHVNSGLASPTYVKVFRVVLLRVPEVEFEVLFDCVDADILFGFHPRLDFVEGDRILDFPVIVRVVTF